jgi:hypothetical protein
MSGWPWHRPTPQPPPVIPRRAIAIIVKAVGGAPVDRASVRLDGHPEVLLTNADGYACFLAVKEDLVQTHLFVTHPQYHDADKHLTLHPGNGDYDAPPLVPLVVPAPPPQGLTRMNGRLVVDDNGPMNALGTTLMWGLHGCKFEPGRLRLHWEWAADMGLQFFRMLGEVRDTDPTKPPFWKDLAIVPVGSVDYPEWPDYEQRVQDCTLMGMSVGMRVEWSIFGTGHDDKRRTVDRWLAGVVPVLSGVQMTEVANESNGFEADGIELRQLAAIIRSRLGPGHPLALTAVSEADTAALYNGSAANIVTFHFDRAPGENGWRWVRQPWPGKDFGAFSDNEPKGDHSSIASDEDPERITMAGVTAFIVGASHHVIHTGAGVRGVDDPARGRVANLWDVPSMGPVCAAMKTWRTLLPPDLAQWTKENWYWAGHPFIIEKQHIGDDALAANYGATRCFAATNGTRFITSPIGIMREFPMRAKSAMHIRCYDWRGVLYDERDLIAGEMLRTGDRASAVIIGEQR